MTRFSTISEVLSYLYEALPMFQRQGAVAYNKDLGKTIKLLEQLGNPQESFDSVHVAGTNGKGTTSHMLASVFHESGYKTGLYTSPHLKNFSERIRIDGIEVSSQYVMDFLNENIDLVEEIKPSFFEITVAMAFDYFRKEQVDIAVIEVGMGGRLDSTNILNPDLSIITNIGLDHTQFLGNTLSEIAGEKAGIIKEGVPVIIGSHQPETDPIFIDAAKKKGAPLRFAETWSATPVGMGQWQIADREGVEFDAGNAMHGDYYGMNIPIVMEALDLLAEKHSAINLDSIIEGLNNTVHATGLKGRWQILDTEPSIVCDTGHNVDGVRILMDQIERITKGQLWMIWGMVNDKDTESILRLLPSNANYIFSTSSVPRALNANDLAELAEGMGLTGRVVHDVNDALAWVRSKAHKEDFVFIGGSTFLVADLEEL